MSTGMDGDTNVTARRGPAPVHRPRDGRDGAVLRAGEAGRDALAALGLSRRLYRADERDDLKTFGLDLPKTLHLRDADAIKPGQRRLEAAMTVTCASAYRALAPKSTTPVVTGEAPAYLKAQLANYQAALARLTRL